MPRGTGRYDEARLQGRLWTPAALKTAPAVWLDARYVAQPASWKNQGTYGGSYAQATSGSQPTVSKSALNGYSLLNFATSKFMSSGSVSGSATDYCVFALGIFSTVSTKPILSWGWDPSNLGFVVYTDFAIGNNTGSYVPNLTYDSTPIRDGKGHSQLVAFGASAGKALLDGVSVAVTDNPTAHSPVTNVISVCTSGPTEMGDHQLGIVLLLPYSPTAREAERIVGWAHWSYGLQNKLPANHPFANRPPLIGT